ncbi:MAG TPA: dephospho-CoA kinase [Gemmatimonadaceae bacterium]|jgi:dephospho-CoA kinase
MLVVGITGNIASGKSTVARLLGVRGIPVIDADLLAREATAPGSPALDAIVARWGAGMRAADGSLDRAALRHIVFASAKDRAALDAIVHPLVEARRSALLAAARERGDRVQVCDIPLLFEAGLTGRVDVIVLVDAPRDLRLVRLIRDRKLDQAEATAMIDAQIPSEEKRARSHYVIDNDSTLDVLRTHVDETWRALEREHLA